MRKYFENLTTVGLVVCAGMFLCSCGNKVKIKENTVDKGGSVVVIATPKSEMIVYTPQPYSTGETVLQGKENESIGYKTGAFEQLHETFEKKYSEGYHHQMKENKSGNPSENYDIHRLILHQNISQKNFLLLPDYLHIMQYVRFS